MADFIFTRTVPSAKVADVKASLLAIWENNETKDDPEWVDPKDGTQAPQVAKYTDLDWLDYMLGMQLKKIYTNGKKKLAKEASIIDGTVFD